MLTLRRTNSDDADFRALIAALDKELWERYPEDQQDYEDLNLDRVKDISTVIVAYVDDQPVGCGCFRPFDEQTVEIKRMFVYPAHRGKGIARTILQQLEAWAGDLAFTCAVLETGVRQPEAIALYQKLSYHTIDKYPPYQDLEMSVCMEKPLL